VQWTFKPGTINAAIGASTANLDAGNGRFGGIMLKEKIWAMIFN
jgi:hypothetical protein